MCGRDVNIEISETYQTCIFFSALQIAVQNPLLPPSIFLTYNVRKARGNLPPDNDDIRYRKRPEISTE